MLLSRPNILLLSLAISFCTPSISFSPSIIGCQSCCHRSSRAGPLNYAKDLAAYRRNERKKLLRHQELLAKQQAPQQPPPQEENEDGVVRTSNSGSPVILEMARRMLSIENDFSEPFSSVNLETESRNLPTVPRWHPVNGISSENPHFRTQSPKMDEEGYAATIWRHARKKSPAMWRYALRCYDRMENNKIVTEETGQPGRGIERSNVHYEGALLACAKLGLWERAFGIYKEVQAREDSDRVQVTEAMMENLVRASVRAARDHSKDRVPLDAAAEAILTTAGNVPLVARHLNPLAAAYQSLGLHTVASELLRTNLANRVTGPEPEDGNAPFNVHDVSAKDKASYSLLVQGEVLAGNWTGAVDALRDMTEAGLYPASRHLNAWTEVSERKTKQRTTRSWKKKREEYWLDSVRPTIVRVKRTRKKQSTAENMNKTSKRARDGRRRRK